MTQENSSKLSFSIEESVWLNKGQEITEVLAMSLDPSISIEERGDHVQIKGGLQLVGEYRSVTEDTSAEENIDSVTFRSIDEVSNMSNGVHEVRHFFPIDVTIPLNRINNLDDIYVQVESFDYDLPDRNCIQLTADVIISGMSTEEQKIIQAPQDYQVPSVETFGANQDFKPPYEESYQARTEDLFRGQQSTQIAPNFYYGQENEVRTKSEQEEPSVGEKDETSFHFEATKQETASISVAEREPELGTQSEAIESVQQEVGEGEAVRTESVDNQSEEEPQQEPQEPRQEAQKAVINIAPLKKIAEEKVVETTPRVEEKENIKNEEVKEKKAKPRKNENALYLTKMLSNGEEQFSRLKMCIIQENESIDTIAERYEITTSQIVRVNRLESERLEEGQILYIPAGKN